MSIKSDKPDFSAEDENLISLEEWQMRNFPQGTDKTDLPELPQFCRLGEGVIKKLSSDKYADDSLNEESLGVGLAVMIQLADAVIHMGFDAANKLKKRINQKINTCLKSFKFRR